MESKNARFLMGLGLGSLLGAVIYRCIKSGKAKEWKEKVCNAVDAIGEQAGEWMCNVQEKSDQKAEV